ncbi:amidase, partial [Burkholderia pseudomallei]
ATYPGALHAPPPALKIGYVTDPMLAPAQSADVRDALDRAAALAASLGHNVEPAALNLVFAQIGEVFLRFWAAFADVLVLGAERITGRKP